MTKNEKDSLIELIGNLVVPAWVGLTTGIIGWFDARIIMKQPGDNTFLIFWLIFCGGIIIFNDQLNKRNL